MWQNLCEQVHWLQLLEVFELGRYVDLAAQESFLITGKDLHTEVP